MNNRGKTITSIAANALMTFLGTYSIIFGSITAFSIKLEEGTVLIFCILSSICISSLFYIEKYKKPIYIGASIFSALFVLAYLEKIVDGFLFFLNIITELFSRFTNAISATDGVALTTLGEVRASTAFFSFSAVVLTFIICFTLIKVHTIWPTLIVSVTSFSLCLIFIKKVPDTLPVVVFFIFLTTLLMMSFVKKGKIKYNSFMYLVFLPLMLVFLLLIGKVFPEGSYNRADIAQDMYRYFSRILPLNSTKNPGVNIDDELSEFSEFSSYEDSGDDISKPDPEAQNNYLGVNLSGADPKNNSDDIVMRVKTNKAGKLLLRGFSLDAYTGNSWLQFNAVIKNNLRINETINPFDDSYNYETIATSNSLATYLAMTSNNAEMSQVEIFEEKAGGEVAYTPYFPVLVGNSSFVYDNDSSVFYKNNYVSHQNIKASYSFNAFDCEDILDELTNMGDSSRQTNEFQQICELEQSYSKFVHQYYTYVNNDTESFLYDYIDGDSFMEIYDREELVDAVRKYVKSCARYNINAKTPPAGQDYVKYFLSESKEGYCMQFATTATLIYRTLGIPARYVSGYFITIANNQLNQKVDVTEKCAHAWVEVYFDGIGWIPVDVTPGFSEEDDTSGSTSGSTSSHDTPSEDPSSQNSDPATSSESNTSNESDPSNANTSSDPSSVNDTSNLVDTSSEPEDKLCVFINEHKTLLIWISAALLFCGMIVTVICRRFTAKKKRKVNFYQSDRNRAAITAWNYIIKLKAYGIVPEKDIYKLAQKAAFSKHILTVEEVAIIISYAYKEAKEIDNKLGFFKRFVFRYFKRLY